MVIAWEPEEWDWEGKVLRNRDLLSSCRSENNLRRNVEDYHIVMLPL